MGSLSEHAVSIAATVKDYRTGEIEPISDDDILKWARQFPAKTRGDLLSEIDSVLKETYFPKRRIKRFIKSLCEPGDFNGNKPKTFWKSANILNIQSRSRSQREMIDLLGDVLSAMGIDISECGSQDGPYVYLDDVIFSGNRVVADLRDWIPDTAPKKCKIIVVAAASHSAAEFYFRQAIPKIVDEAKKEIRTPEIWRLKMYNNLSNDGGSADVLRLREFPTDDASVAFIEEFGDRKAPALLRGCQNNSSRLFSSEAARDKLEQVLWHSGLEARAKCPMLKTMHRPLGYTSTGSANKLGFGSLIVTYRNCPNNVPLPLWVGDPWTPLFPRKNN
jgi:hypothetical protein